MLTYLTEGFEEYQVAGANADCARRFAEKSRVGGCHKSGVPELWTLGHIAQL